jgi:hypothetical protein
MSDSSDILASLPRALSWALLPLSLPGDLLYSLLSVLVLVLYLVIGIIFSTFTNVVVGQQIAFLFIAFIGLCGLWLFISSSNIKRMVPDRWLESLGLIIFFNSIFGITYFITSKVKEPPHLWQVPAVNISEKIERQELGWFYPFVPNFEFSDVMDAYYPDLYRLEPQAQGFTVQHVNRYNYWINTGNMASLSKVEIKRQGEYIEPQQEVLTEAQYMKMREESAEDPKPQQPSGFSCTDKDGQSKTFEEKGQASSQIECAGIRYRGQDIWQAPAGQSYIVYVRPSVDDNWALIRVGRDYAVFVYLIDLRPLK